MTGLDDVLADRPVSPEGSAGRLPAGRTALVAVAIAVCTATLYLPVLDAGFVGYDDPEYVVENARVQHGLTLDNAAWAFTTTSVSNWHPVTWLSYMVDASLFGIDARAFHATNIALHALNAGLLFWLLWTATGRAGPSVVVAALFAVHPLNVQSVAWVAERKNVLSTCFWLLSMLAYTAWTRRPRAAVYAVVCAMLVLSLLAKPMAVTLPFVLLLWDDWPLGRGVVWHPRLWLEKAPLFVIVVLFAAVTYQVQHAAGSVTNTSFALADRLSNATWSYVAYLGKAMRPRDLVVFYPLIPGRVSPGYVAAALAILVGVTAALVRTREQARPQLVGWLWYLGTLVPVIGVVQVGAQAMADRYAYVPLIGIFIAVAWTGAALAAESRAASRVLAALATLLVVTHGARAVQEMQYWRDSRTLFEHTVRVEPEAWVAHYNLGTEYAKRGDYEHAIPRFRDTIRLAPNFARGYHGMGNVFDAQGKTAEAIGEYQRALALDPTLVEAQNNLGVAFAVQGRRDEALRLLRSATITEPSFVEAHINLGMLLRNSGKLDEALTEGDLAVALAPGKATAVYQRALSRVAAGRLADARADVLTLRLRDGALATALETALAAAGTAPTTSVKP